MSYGAQEIDYRPPNLSAKQDAVVQLTARYIAYSADPSRYQFLVRERTKHNHNFTFLVDGDRAYDYYRYLLHAHLERARLGYKNERYNRDQFVQDYTAQLQRHQEAYATSYHHQIAAPAPSSAVFSEEPPRKMPRTEDEGPQAVAAPPAYSYNNDDDEDEDEGPKFRIVIENGVQRVVTD